MDDILGGEVKTSEVVQLTESIENILGEGGFHIKEWIMASDVNSSA